MFTARFHAWRRRSGLAITSHCTGFRNAARPSAHAIIAIAEVPRPDTAARVQPEHAASAARPWPSVEKPTVRTDRDGAQNPVRLPASARDRKWFRGGHVTVLGRASLCSLALIAAGSCEPPDGSGGAERPRSGAAGALDASGGSGSLPAGGNGSEPGVGGFRAGVVLSLEIGVALIDGRDGGRRGGSQAYLGPRALAAPGDMMIDWASSRLRGMRPLSLCRPSAWRCAAGPVADGSGLAGADRGCAPSGEVRLRLAGPAGRVTMATVRTRDARAQAALSASSPSSARMWHAWRMILRASDRAARLPSLRSLTCA